MTHEEQYARGVSACSAQGQGSSSARDRAGERSPNAKSRGEGSEPEQPVLKRPISPCGRIVERLRGGGLFRPFGASPCGGKDLSNPRPRGAPHRRAAPPPRARRSALGLLLLLGACLVLAGCGDQIRRPTPEELARFQAADPPPEFSDGAGSGAAAGPAVDMSRVLQAKIIGGPYRAVAGDVLRLEMPRFVEPRPTDTAAGADNRQICNCRIADNGQIILPLVGALTVAGKSLAEIEAAIVAQYYPKYVAAPLPVYVSVAEYQTQRVSIVGAVAQPGIHALRHDQMSLVSLLMQAGGITTQGAAVIRITRSHGRAPGAAPAEGTLKVVPSALFGPPPLRRPGGPRSSELRPPAWHAVFEREGPLRTTGWLSARHESGPGSVRQWLDVANEPQRREFLKVLAAQAKQPGVEDLGPPLARLAAYLEAQDHLRAPETAPAESAIGTSPSGIPVSPLPGWLILDRGRFVTAAETPAAETAAPVRQVKEDSPADALPAQTHTLVLPVRGLNIPFADVTLVEGDTVVVEPPQEQSVAVLGLVAKPGNMPYPPGARYNLIQAIAYAGGLDLVADPRYVSVYRLAPDGRIASVTFRLVDPHRQQKLTGTLALPLKPGDVVSVEHTPRTRMNVFLDRVFRVTLGLYLNPWDAWND